MKNKKELVAVSKLLSLVLRHEPGRIGLVLDDAGWTPVDLLLDRLAHAGRPIDRETLELLVADSDKQRFAFSEDGLRIRANQGHSVAVELDLPAVAPPALLYHGTATRFIEAILREGLTRQARHHVHLSAQRDTARAVGLRHGTLAMLLVDAARMHADGHVFHCTANGVWLACAVPPAYLAVE